MAKNVTYLFGAGASFHALPLVSQIPQRMFDFMTFMQNEEVPLDLRKLRTELVKLLIRAFNDIASRTGAGVITA